MPKHKKIQKSSPERVIIKRLWLASARTKKKK